MDAKHPTHTHRKVSAASIRSKKKKKNSDFTHTYFSRQFVNFIRFNVKLREVVEHGYGRWQGQEAVARQVKLLQ